MSDDQKNPPAQPEFGELAPEGWSWNPEANAPHTPETLKAAEAAAKAAAKAKAAHAAATARLIERGDSRGTSTNTASSAAAKPAKAAKPARGEKTSGLEHPDAAEADKPARAEKPVKPAKQAKAAKGPAAIFVAPDTAPANDTLSGRDLSEDEKKTRAVALARLASDRFITWGLLALAAFSVITGLGDYLNLTQTLNAAYDQLNAMEPGLNLAPYANPSIAKLLGWAVVMSQAVLIGLTFWWAIRRMRSSKLAFWVPVVGFAASSVIVLVALILAFVADPTAWDALLTYIQNTSAVTPTISPNA